MSDIHGPEHDSLSFARARPRLPSAQQMTALLARARYAHHHGQYVWLSWTEREALGDVPLAAGPTTLFSVTVGVDNQRAERQTAAAIAHPAPPMDWEIEG